MKQECRLRRVENRVLRRKFGSKTDEVNGELSMKFRIVF
jgi:hypothetical protein